MVRMTVSQRTARPQEYDPSLSDALRSCLALIRELDRNMLLPPCEELMSDNGSCRACQAMQDADYALSEFDAKERYGDDHEA